MKTFYCVETVIYDGRPRVFTFHKTETSICIYEVDADTKPENTFESLETRDIYKNYFETLKEAQDYINEEYDG